MELRVLKYFLMVAREGSITAAANALHITQPTLSRQIRELEEEVGSPLFVRGSHSISLTEEGVLLRKRASEILELVEKTQREMARTFSSGWTRGWWILLWCSAPWTWQSTTRSRCLTKISGAF